MHLLSLFNSCEIEGEYVNGRIIFNELNGLARTDKSFRERRNEEHHVSCNAGFGGTVSSLEEVPQIDMVKDFILDPMHLLYLGVFRRLLCFWIKKGPLACRLSSAAVSQIDRRTLKLSPFFPKCFSRKPRALKYLAQFKATEYRTFLLYAGPIVFQDIVSPANFSLYMLLHVASFILSHRQCLKFLPLAQRLLRDFVISSKCNHTCGSHFTTYNVHSILHMADDVEYLSLPLDSISAFSFENFFVRLKHAIKSPHLPHEQVINSVKRGFLKPVSSANCAYVYKKCSNIRSRNFPQKPHFCSLTYKDDLYSIAFNDSFILTDCNKLFQIAYIVQSDYPILVCKDINNLMQNLYDLPIPSSYLGIFKVSINAVLEYHSDLIAIDFRNVKGKYICLPTNCDEYFALFPL